MKLTNVVPLSFFLLCSVFVFFLSIYIVPHVVSGDQQSYIGLYNSVEGVSYSDGYELYRLYTGAFEPFYFSIIWFFSNIGADKVLLVSFVNSALCFLFLRLSQKIGLNVVISIVIVFSCYYFVALYTEIERLKFSFVFLFMSLFFLERRVYFIALSVLAVLTQFQAFIFYFCLFMPWFFYQVRLIIINFKISYWFLVFLSLALVVALNFKDPIIFKFNYYFSADSLVEHALYDFPKIFVFFGLSYAYGRFDKSAIVTFFPLAAISFFIGADRLSLIAFFLLLYYASRTRSGWNMGLLMPVIFLSLKGFDAYLNIFEMGRVYAG
ncbi:hypothetical protein [Halomonas aestuarii]|uniref:hypothetical protein n=1 Tax=Halomonas aestuarii TaxID=1897729 RepID=UPI000F76811B|nr:hypothetical protein [Halomonas aestuarii]